MIIIKIGVITSAYPEYEDDPHGIFVHRLMREVSKQGHEVHVLAPVANEKMKYVLDGVNVERFNYFYPRKYQRLTGRSGMIDNVKEGFLVKIQVLSFLFFNLIYSLVKLRDVDIVHVQWPIPNGLGALFLNKIYRIPYITTIHGEEVYLAKRYHLRCVLRLLVNNSSKTISNSSATYKACVEAGLDEDKLKIIPFGVDTSFFSYTDVHRNDRYFQILSVGYLIERKGHEYLIKAIKEIIKERDDVRLKIVGSGPLEGKLKKLIEELGLNKFVKIIKNVSDKELLKLYNSSDIFVLPSIVDSQGNTEGLGIVLLEAMACGLPVIGSKVGGIPDIIKDEKTGLLVEEKDVNMLFKTITELLKNNDLKENLSMTGCKLANNRFSWDNVAKMHLKAYKEVKKINKD